MEIFLYHKEIEALALATNASFIHIPSEDTYEADMLVKLGADMEDALFLMVYFMIVCRGVRKIEKTKKTDRTIPK